MKIAATYDNGNIFQHFGKTEFFKVYEVEDNKVISSEVISSNGTGHGALAGLLAEQGISVLICGGIGGGAQSALAEAGIELCSGAQGDADTAVDAYLKADMLKPDHLWTLRHLATCYRQMKNFDAALEYYHRVETIQPENHNVLFYTASCLAEQKRYEDALQYFFKLDFLENNCMKAWRGIGWCSFISLKYEQAMKYYEKIIEHKPLAIDYMNAGHVAWVMGNIQKAAVLYGKAITACGTRERFLEMFHKDEEPLLKQGIREEDIPLMLDLL